MNKVLVCMGILGRSKKTNEKMMDMTRILAPESMLEDVEKSSNAWI